MELNYVELFATSITYYKTKIARDENDDDKGKNGAA
jgi:hypothetical protein